MTDPSMTTAEARLNMIRAYVLERLDQWGIILTNAPEGSIAHEQADHAIETMLGVLRVIGRTDSGTTLD